MSALWKSACSRAAMLAVLLSIAPSALWASAAFDPNTARGFAGKAYQLGELDNVNLFNGNLTVRLPLGPGYSVGPSLSYSFVLTSNSKVWDYRAATGAGPRMPIPETLSNAGMGWNLHLGKLVPPSSVVTPHGWLYIGPDGSQHEFKGTGPVYYSEDGSYLRLHLDPLLDGSVHWVHFPDGTRAEFYAAADTTTLRAAGSLRSIMDRFENYVAVAYSAATCDDPSTTTIVEKCAVWTITDGHGTTNSGRSHIIRFANKVSKYGGETENYHQVVSSVELASFDSATRAVYTLHYQDDGSPNPTQIPRQLCGGGELGVDPNTVVPLLSGVTLPDSSAFSMEYVQDPVLYGDCNSGSLLSLTTPTGGKIAYEYGTYESTLPDCNDQDYWTTAYGGVTKRKFYRKASDAQPEGVWTYTSRLTPRPGALPYSQNCSGQWTQVWEAPEEMTTTVVDPVGNKTVHYFSVYPKLALASHSTFKAAENGLPLTRRTDPLATGGLWLSSESYEGATLKRRTFVTYDTDYAVLGDKAESQLKKRRVYDVTDTGCSGTCYVETANDQYDLNGHYKETVTSSNLPGSITRKTFTNYTPAVSAWLLNLYDEAYVTEDHGTDGWKTRKTISAFDNLTGALLSTRILRATSGTNTQVAQSGNDILTLQCRDTGTTAGARGFVTSERHFGGDLAVIPGNVTCSTGAASNSGHYVINHAYTFSGKDLTGHTAQYAGAGVGHLIADEVFDPNTGKVKTSRDSAGIATTYVYDKSGRLTAVKPTGEASTTYKYQVTSDPPTLTIRNCPTGSDSCDSGNLTEARFYFDGLGRLTEERRRMPLGQWSALWNTYDALGRTKKTTIPVTTASGSSGADSSAANTTWDYDFSGRVLKETRPDGSTTQFGYTGVRQKTISITHPGSSVLQLRSTEQYDGGGRLVKVIQPSGPTSHTTLVGADVPTEYKYDIGDRLRSVKMTGTESGTPQSRTFTYDGAGFLTGEVHPESGTVSYTGYDARGHAQKRLPSGAPTIFKQQYTYDAAERLTQVDTGTPDWTGSGAEYRPQKVFTYSTASDSSKGRILSAVRHNYPHCTSGCGNNIRVTETYGYDSVGRKNSRTTVIDDVPTSGSPVLIKSISQSFSYNTLGLPDAVNYPTCSNCGVPPGPDPARNFALGYSEGMLQSVGGYVSSMTYAPTGAVTNVAHGNGIGDTVALDTTGRPQSITFNTWSSCGTPAKIESEPGDLTVASGTTAIIQVPASGTNLSFQLYEAVNATTYAGATPIGSPTSVGNLTTPTLTATKYYYVRVSNACKSVNTRIVTVTVTTGCNLPTMTSPSSQNIQSGATATLTVTTDATTFQWYRGYTGDTSTPVGTNSATFVTPQLYATTRYWVRVTNSCGSRNSLTVKITVALPPPTNLVATKVSSSNQVKLTWSPSAGAAKYQVWRRRGSATFSLMDANAQSPWFDQQAIAGRAYVYKVSAVDVDGFSESAYSNNDIAIVTNFTPIVANTTLVDDAHLEELLTSLNAVRAAKSLADPAWQWSDILPAGVPAPASGGLILRKYIEVLRSQFTSALQGLDLPAPAYTDPSLVGLQFRAIHLTELQERAK